MALFSGFFSRPKNFLGVDIGTSSIKIVEILDTGALPKLQNYGWLNGTGSFGSVKGIIQTNSLKILEKETSVLLKFLLKKMKTRTRDAVASLPSFLAYISLLELPDMSKEDTARAMNVQPYQYIPLPLSEVVVDWLKVGGRQNEQGNKIQQILLTAVPKEHVRRYGHIFKKAGLKLSALEIETFGLARALVGNDPTATLLIDFGAYSTNIAVVDKGFLKFNSHTDYASNSLTRAVVNGLNIGPKRAEDLKNRLGVTATGGEVEISGLMTPFLDVIIRDIRKAKDIFERRCGVKIERCLLAGNGSNLKGLEQYLGEQINLPIMKGTAFKRLSYPRIFESVFENLSSPFAVAIGLGLREMSRK